MKIAYLANRFPSSVEPYVMQEISGLRAAGIEVAPCSARRAGRLPASLCHWREATLYLQSLRLGPVLRSIAGICLECRELRPFLRRILSGNETLLQRAKAILHTWLGVYYAVLLKGAGVRHIHVHHGYFSAWIAMVAARLLGIGYSMTLHGSDLLLHAAYLDIKLERCAACFTVSEYNRQMIFRRYPSISPEKVLLRRMGVELPALSSDGDRPGSNDPFLVLAVGRLHPVKDHEFLIDACALMKARRLNFVCFIAGNGPQRKKLERKIRALGLQREVKLLGHVAHEDLDAIYPLIDLVALTSRSEGIPLALMEAMVHERPVLAPRITGIPELVIHGTTGFLYEPGSLSEFSACVELAHSSLSALGPLRRAAREHVRKHFNHGVNLQLFIETLRSLICCQVSHENPILQ